MASTPMRAARPAGQGQALRIQQVHMQAAEREQVHLQSSGDQWLTAVTAESDLIDQAGVQGPLQQGPASPL